MNRRTLTLVGLTLLGLATTFAGNAVAQPKYQPAPIPTLKEIERTAAQASIPDLIAQYCVGLASRVRASLASWMNATASSAIDQVVALRDAGNATEAARVGNNALTRLDSGSIISAMILANIQTKCASLVMQYGGTQDHWYRIMDAFDDAIIGVQQDGNAAYIRLQAVLYPQLAP